MKQVAIGVGVIAAAALGALITSFGVAGDETAGAARKAGGFTAAEEARIRELVRDYIVENPEVIVDGLNVLQEREMAVAETRLEDGARANFETLISGAGGYVAGTPTQSAQVVVVELFDYHCGFCKRAAGLVRDLVKDDPAVSVVFMELPILREESETAAAYALAARGQDKYLDLHFALMDENGVLTPDRIRTVARKAGLDVKALDAAKDAEAIGAEIAQSKRIAREMGVDGTPSFIVATADGAYLDVLTGYRPEDLKVAIGEAKKAAADDAKGASAAGE